MTSLETQFPLEAPEVGPSKVIFGQPYRSPSGDHTIDGMIAETALGEALWPGGGNEAPERQFIRSQYHDVGIGKGRRPHTSDFSHC